MSTLAQRFSLFKTFAKAFLRPNARALLLRDLYRFHLGPQTAGLSTINPWTTRTYIEAERAGALDRCIEWLLSSQSQTPDAGFGTYSLTEGWGSSYPETTGYIIPTLLHYAALRNRADVAARALAAADWLLAIQRPSGGWQGGYLEDRKEETVFNTGQVIRGLVVAYQHSRADRYLAGAVRGCDWLCSIQDADGAWRRYTFLGLVRVYDSYVSFPLLMAHEATGDSRYKESAVRNLRWVLSKQRDNGWFDDADNSAASDSSILHTIAYTLDGLLDSGMLLGDEAFVAAAQRGADSLFRIFGAKKRLVARYDHAWRGTARYLMPTGCAQVAILWLKLHAHTRNIQYLNAAMKLDDLLLFLQDRHEREHPATRGALAGSFPLWQNYQLFRYPNWATKFFADALMLEERQLRLAESPGSESGPLPRL